MQFTIPDIENYLAEVKQAVKTGRYRLDVNEKRQKNRDLFLNYMLDEQKAKEILLDLSARDFSNAVRNEHLGFEHEWLYIFGKSVILLERYGQNESNIPLYIKFNKLQNQFVIVISFHKQEYPLPYYFEETSCT